MVSRTELTIDRGRPWHQDGVGGVPLAARPIDAERWQLDMWLTPHGFLKAARLPGANPVATWRWELGEMGRDGAAPMGASDTALEPHGPDLDRFFFDKTKILILKFGTTPPPFPRP